MTDDVGRRVEFLGLGTMGSRMARRLLDGGYRVAVYNRTPDIARPLLEVPAQAMRRHLGPCPMNLASFSTR